MPASPDGSTTWTLAEAVVVRRLRARVPAPGQGQAPCPAPARGHPSSRRPWSGASFLPAPAGNRRARPSCARWWSSAPGSAPWRPPARGPQAGAGPDPGAPATLPRLSTSASGWSRGRRSSRRRPATSSAAWTSSSSGRRPAGARLSRSSPALAARMPSPAPRAQRRPGSAFTAESQADLCRARGSPAHPAAPQPKLNGCGRAGEPDPHRGVLRGHRRRARPSPASRWPCSNWEYACNTVRRHQASRHLTPAEVPTISPGVDV